MADFATWVSACEPGLECKSGSFLKAYTVALNDAIIDTISSDGLAQTIITIAEHEKHTWSGNATQLLSKINNMNGYNYQRPPMGWPQTASTLSNKLNRLAPSLRRVGVEIEFKKTAKARIITIKMRDDGVTANDGELRKGRHNENRIQENLNSFKKGHNDGDDGDSLSLSSEKGEEENKHKEKCDIKSESSDKTPSSPSIASLGNDCGPHIAVTSPSSSPSDDDAPKMGPHPRKEEPTPTKSVNPIISDRCLICGQEIGPGHSSATFEGKNYCTSCVPSLSMIRVSAKTLAGQNGRGPTTTEIHADIALRGRPPRMEHIPAMLNAVGFVENEGRWEGGQRDANEALHPDLDASISLELVAKEVERLNADEKPIVAQVLEEKLGLKIQVVGEQLKELGYVMTGDVDPITHFCSWKKGGKWIEKTATKRDGIWLS
jgi:hypothetical protein